MKLSLTIAAILTARLAVAADCSGLINDPARFVPCMKAEASRATFPVVPIPPTFELSRVIAPNGGSHYPQASSTDYGSSYAAPATVDGYHEARDDWWAFIPHTHGCQTGIGGLYRACW